MWPLFISVSILLSYWEIFLHSRLTIVSNGGVTPCNTCANMSNENQPISMEAHIIEAAKRVFVRKGFEAATMSDAASEAGIGRTALHYYYRTKERLFEAVLEEITSGLFLNIDRILERNREATFLELLPDLLDLYMGIIWRNRMLPVFIVNELNRDPAHFISALIRDPERIKPLFRLREMVEREMAAGLLRQMPVIDVLSVTVSLVIFPMLVRRPLTMILMEGDEERFGRWWLGRRPLVVDQVRALLKPDGEEVSS